MKRTTIITAKTLDRYAKLIEQGIKHYEVRSDSLEAIDAIHLVSAETGKSLGTYEVLHTFHFGRDDDEKVMLLAQTTADQFYKLFPKPELGGPTILWVAELGKPVNLEILVSIEKPEAVTK